MVEVLVAEFGGDEEETRFEDAEGGGERDGVEVFDFERENLFSRVFDRDLVEISLL